MNTQSLLIQTSLDGVKFKRAETPKDGRGGGGGG